MDERLRHLSNQKTIFEGFVALVHSKNASPTWNDVKSALLDFDSAGQHILDDLRRHRTLSVGNNRATVQSSSTMCLSRLSHNLPLYLPALCHCSTITALSVRVKCERQQVR